MADIPEISNAAEWELVAPSRKKPATNNRGLALRGNHAPHRSRGNFRGTSNITPPALINLGNAHQPVLLTGGPRGRGRGGPGRMQSNIITNTRGLSRGSSRTSHSSRGRPDRMAQAVNDSQLAYDNGEPATGVFQFPAPWRVVRESYARHRADPYPALVNIGRKTGAYVKVYSEQYASSVAHIWGTAQQIEKARQELDAMVSACRLPTVSRINRTVAQRGVEEACLTPSPQLLDIGTPPSVEDSIVPSDRRQYVNGATTLEPRVNDHMVVGPRVNGVHRNNGPQARYPLTPRSVPEKGPGFAKIGAYNDLTELHHVVQERIENFGEQLRRGPAPSEEIPFEGNFLWPADVCSLDQFIEEHDKTTMQELRLRTRSFIQYDKQNDLIQILSDTKDGIVMVFHRIRGLAVEIVAKMNSLKRLYLVNAPGASIMKPCVDLVTYNIPGATKSPVRPCLDGVSREDQDRDRVTWEKDRLVIIRQNKEAARQVVEGSLYSLRLPQKHIRMRVHFGRFTLSRYRKPEDGSDMHGFVDFRQMLANPNTFGQLQQDLDPGAGDDSLQSRCCQAEDLLAPFDINADTLMDTEPSYSVGIDIDGGDASLRLEQEFRKSSDGLFELHHTRWLRVDATSGTPLDLAMVDFERCDWQLKVDVAELYKEKSVDKALQSFASQVVFTPVSRPADGQRRVTYPAGSQPIKRIEEITTWSFELKGTDYIFSLAKHDLYLPNIADPVMGRYNPLLAQRNMAKLPITSWGATLRHREWDNKLAEQARLRPGQAASWEPSLEGFFPPDTTSTNPDKSQGFWHFWDQVERVAEFLRARHRPEGVKDSGQPYGDLVIKNAPESSADSSARETDMTADQDAVESGTPFYDEDLITPLVESTRGLTSLHDDRLHTLGAV